METTNNRNKKLLFAVLGMIAVFGAWMLCSHGINYLAKGINSPLTLYLLGLLGESILLGGGIILAIVQKRAGILKPTGKGMATGLLVGLYILIVGAAGVTATYTKWLNGTCNITFIQVLTILITYFLVGAAEEVFFRGILQNNLHEYFGEDSRKNIRKAIFFTALPFGLIHLINIFSGVAVSGAVIQALANIGVGMLFSTVYYRSHKNLWACILLHGFMDFGAILLSTASGMTATQTMSSYTVVVLIPALIEVMIVLFATRKKVIAKYIYPEYKQIPQAVVAAV